MCVFYDFRFGDAEAKHVSRRVSHVAVLSGMAEFSAETCGFSFHRTCQRRKVSACFFGRILQEKFAVKIVFVAVVHSVHFALALGAPSQ